jgi:hypothetical protein
VCDAVCLVVVVEQRVGLVGLRRELAQRFDPLPQLVLVAEVVEQLDGDFGMQGKKRGCWSTKV